MIQLFAFLPFPKPKEKEGPFVGRRGSGGCVRALVRACVRAIHMITCVQLPALACWLGIPAMPSPAPQGSKEGEVGDKEGAPRSQRAGSCSWQANARGMR